MNDRTPYLCVNTEYDQEYNWCIRTKIHSIRLHMRDRLKHMKHHS